jgi:alpha-beta hydrolase superfamily lysophospholipase
MEHNEGTFRGFGSIELVYQRWRPTGEPRAVVAIVHGFGEYSGRYMNVVNCLVPDGYAVYAFDLRGYGRSPGQRGFINLWSDYREDTHAFVQFVAAQEIKRPLFLLGHSLGGLIALEYVLHYPEGLSGVIASGPLLVQPGVSPVLLMLSHLLSRIYPTFSLKTGLDASTISRDPAVVTAYQADPLVHSYGTPRLSTEIAAAVAWTQAHAPDLKLPILIIHGGADRLVSPEGSRNFFDKLTISDKQRIEYAGAYHECHNDVIFQQVLTDLEKWLQKHIPDGDR